LSFSYIASEKKAASLIPKPPLEGEKKKKRKEEEKKTPISHSFSSSPSKAQNLTIYN
jgi:hypothetical protein